MGTRFIKIAGTALAAILLGAIGSGVWSELLSPLWNAFIVIIVKLFTYFSSSLTDSIYFEAAKGFHEKHALSLLLLITGMLTGVFVTLIAARLLLRIDRPKDVVVRFVRSKYEYFVFSFILLVPIVMSMFIAFYSSYSNKVTTSSLNSIDIVAPYVGVDEALRLKSQFHQIKSRKDYVTFYSRMKDIGEKNKLVLPLTEPL
jgi:hypothetical protein